MSICHDMREIGESDDDGHLAWHMTDDDRRMTDYDSCTSVAA